MACAVLLLACGGGDSSGGNSNGTTTGGATTAPGQTTPGSATATPGGETSADDDLDVCALLSREEIEAVIGGPTGPPQREDAGAPFFGCRYEDEGDSAIVTVGVIAHPDAETAEDSFDFGASSFPAVEGIGDRAYNSQPIDDIAVLSGRYEVSIGLYFVGEDDEVELEMARQLAETLLGRLP